jgi:lipopolysaccharide heptosyltransferase II
LPQNEPENNLEKILIINPFGIGDVLFTTPIIHTLKEAFMGVKIGYLCNRRTACLLENNPYIDYIFVYERDEFEAMRKESFFVWFKNFFAFLNQIKNKHFDLALDFSLNTPYGFFCWYAGIRMRIGYNFKKRGKFLTKKIPLSGYQAKHIVEYYAELLEYLDISLKYRQLELHLKKEDVKQSEEILNKAGISKNDFLVGIIPGAGRSWGKDAYIKHWPAKNFAALADKIIENYQAKIIIMGDFSEIEIAQKIMNSMKYAAVDLSGKTTLGELAALISKTKMLITNDGGPLHMAVALGIKTISFFGPVDEKVYGPYPPSNHHIVLKKDMPCRPCYRNFKLPLCSRNRECINSISIEEAFAVVRSLWNERDGPAFRSNSD